MAQEGREAVGVIVPPLILGCRKLSENVSIRKCSTKNANLRAEGPLFWTNLGAKLKFKASIISCEKKIAAVCLKITTFWANLLFQPTILMLFVMSTTRLNPKRLKHLDS